MGCKEEAEAKLGAAVAEFFDAHAEFSQAIEAIEESKWSLGEAVNDAVVCAAQVEDDKMNPLDKAGMVGCIIEGIFGGRKAIEAHEKAWDQRQAAHLAMFKAVEALKEVDDFYCECIRTQGQSSIDPAEIQQMIDEAHDAIADLEEGANDLEAGLDELDSLLSELEDAVASIEDDDSDAALVA